MTPGPSPSGPEPHRPPAGLPGLDPAWSQVVVAPDAEDVPRSWHVLDNGPLLQARAEPVVGTVLCVHGNPTWSYLWRRVLQQAPPGWRVVAPDHLGMGWSERTDGHRDLAQRVADLERLTATLGLEGPVVVLAHDWGGPISLGWTLRHLQQVVAVALTNTAVHQPAGSPAPAAIRLARAPGVLELVCRRTPAFVRAATATCVPPLPLPVQRAFASPYGTPSRRAAVRDFVADIPLEPAHPSFAALQGIRDELDRLADLPVLLVWGPRDPVFSARYLHDLIARLPHADVHRYEDASHLVLEDRPDGVELIWRWITEPRPTAVPAPHADQVPVRVDVYSPDRVAVVELGRSPLQITFGALADRVESLARGLAARGVRPGHRVALLVPPGIDFTTLVYAVWRLGAVVVVADTGLGLRRLGAALRSAGPDHVVGTRPGLALAKATRVPGLRTRLEHSDIPRLTVAGEAVRLPEADHDEDRDGAVLFTSGATGPPKGVVYSRARLGAQLALLRRSFGLGPQDRFVAAFAPFSLYGPALGMTSVVPDMDVTAPDTLTAPALAEAVRAVDATVVFASPAALRNVVATGSSLPASARDALSRVRLVLSAGAPVPADLLRRVRELLPAAATHTPYGMTEALPVTTVDPLVASPDRSEAEGVRVGRPLPGVQVAVAPLDVTGRPAEELTTDPGVVGEIVVHGPHVKTRYDRRWGAQRDSERPAGWHRTGDVGSLAPDGELRVSGRLAHVVTTPDGPVPPYPVEERIEALPGVQRAAVVGVGPTGTQQVVAVVVPAAGGGGKRTRSSPAGSRLGRGTPLASAALAGSVRGAAGVPVAAVLVRDWLPVDVRHASKVDRQTLARWATRWLHGRRAAREAFRGVRPAPARRGR